MIQDFLPTSHSRDDKAANVILKAQERKATLLGLNAPLRVDPIQLAQESAPQLSSTGQLRAIFEEWRAAGEKADEVGADRPGVVPGK